MVNIQTLPVPSSASISNEEVLFSLRLQIDHIPILNLKWMSRGKQPAATLPVELAGVWCASKGAQLVQQLTLNKDVWFKMYGINQDRTVLYSSVVLKKVVQSHKQCRGHKQ